MHIPDGFLSPAVALATGAAAAGGVGVSLIRTRGALADRTAPLMGMMAAFVFAAQMVNFPVPGATSGHLLGGVLAAAALGPWAGMLVIAVVLAVQALLFADGGITALGANVLNMAVIGSGLGYMLYAPVRRMVGGPAGVVAGGVIAAWFSVQVSALACAAELALSGEFGLPAVLNALLLSHVWIGLGEAAITGLALSSLVATRPDLIYDPDRADGAPTGTVLGGAAGAMQFAAAGLAAALVIGVFLSPFKSTFGDGLEVAAESLGLEEVAVWTWSPMPGYWEPDEDADEPPPVWRTTSVAGGIGTLATGAIAFGLAFGVARRGARHGAVVAAKG